MKIERFEVPGLAQYSYIVSSDGMAVVIDPIRDVDCYVDYVSKASLSITHVLETHIHADFASGATALAAATGAELWLSGHDTEEDYQYRFPHHEFRDGESLELGKLKIVALHTPGHTPEHLSFLLFDLERSPSLPVALFSGDFLFVGSFGRPDLLGEGAKEKLAAELYRSMKHRIAALPDNLEVYPGHGAGSLCGSGMGEQQQTTLGYERSTNPFFPLSEDVFVHKILASVPSFPGYYRRMKELNSMGAPLLHALPGDHPLSPVELESLLRSEPLILLDLRRPESFGGAHIPGAINIGVGQNISLWAGWMLSPKVPIVLIGDDGDLEQARRSLIRVGLDNIRGHLAGGISPWIDRGHALGHIAQRSVHEVEAAAESRFVLDVRSDSEWDSGHIAGATHIALGDLSSRIADLPRNVAITAVCGSGYRSSIAASFLSAHGFAGVLNMAGGMSAWRRQHLPEQVPSPGKI